MSSLISIIGAGSWGTAVATLLAKKDNMVKIWARRQSQAEEINTTRENSQYLPGVRLPSKISVTTDLEQALWKAEVIIYGVPSHAFRETVRLTLPFLRRDSLYINIAKGIEEASLYRLSEIFAEEAGQEKLDRYVTLSGPSHAEEVGLELPTAIVAASSSIDSARLVQDLFMSENFRVYTNPDVTGVELGGALKNIIALGTGIAEGLGFGDNTRAALMTRGLAEISRLGISMGAYPLTFAGLAGVGDLIVTCTSRHSRNRRAGIAIGAGHTVSEALEQVKMVVEGVRTTRAVHELISGYTFEMPITDQIYKVLFEGLSPRAAVSNLMTRGRTGEMEEVAKLAVQLVKKV